MKTISLFLKTVILSQLVSINSYCQADINKLKELATGQKANKYEYSVYSLIDTLLYIPVTESMDIDFDPSQLFEHTDSGTVYTGKFHISGSWGVLDVDGKMFLEEDWEYLVLEKPKNNIGSVIKGSNWVLELSGNWYIDSTAKPMYLKQK